VVDLELPGGGQQAVFTGVARPQADGKANGCASDVVSRLPGQIA
jgi:hypothetical protein